MSRTKLNALAFEVVAHAVQRRGRGRGPSRAYLHESNPAKALVAASAQLSSNTRGNQESIADAVTRKLILAKLQRKPQKLDLGNGWVGHIHHTSLPEHVVATGRRLSKSSRLPSC